MARYVPNQRDIDWANMILELMGDNGILAYPASRLIYRVEHKNKRLVLTNPTILNEDFHSFVIHMMTIEVFKTVGYEVWEEA